MKHAGLITAFTVLAFAALAPRPTMAMTVAPSPLGVDAGSIITKVQGNQQQFRRNNNNNRNANRGNNNNNRNANRNNNNRQNANRNNNRQNNRNFNNNRNRNRNVNVNVRVNTRPVRGWGWRPYYGSVVAGVALGTIIAASTIPVAPAPNLCWYWSDPSMTRGYWDYCG